MSVLDKAKAILNRRGIGFDELDDHIISFIRVGMIGGRMRICQAGQFMACTIEIPIFVNDDRRLAMAEAVARANWGLVLGHFEIDLGDDAELRFRATLPVFDAEVTDQQITTLMYRSWSIVRQYADALAMVGIGSQEPAEAIAKADQPSTVPTAQVALPAAVN